MVQVANDVGAASRPVVAGFGVRPSVPGKDGDLLVPQRRDVVVLLAAGPTPATAIPRHPVSASHATETSYVYYTAIPRFCAVTTSTVVLPTSSGTLAGGLVNNVWAPGAVVRGQITRGSEAPLVAELQGSSGKNCGLLGNVVLSTSSNCNAVWTPTAVLGSAVTPRTVASAAGVSHHNLTTSCVKAVAISDSNRTVDEDKSDAAAVSALSLIHI